MHILALALAAVVGAAHPAPGVAGGASPSADATWTETRDGEAPPAPGTRFKCQDGADLVAHFDTRGPRLIAVVDAGDGPHALPIRPWDGGPVQLTWSDGTRTLTWSPGVQIMWMEGGVHRMCGREGHHH
ncbi:hypothetical protein [Phenylobacterium sp.]|uniref:hypothetical protein n=1 Tax=Phenylobacterium sp. TaxID=1871053 RepID=UPI002E3224DB|nr:hypothetical protein [Phenylobacterium sp.]HEX3363763.1 hypothetical protein [Phenylobacterium sp.]